MMDMYPIMKSLHLIFMVSWLAGLFFLGRVMIYFVEAEDKPEKTAIQSFLSGGMKRVMSIVVWPSLIFTTAFGLHLAMVTDAFAMPWFHLKMLLVILLIGYTHGLWSLSRKMIDGRKKPSVAKLRILNELPFVFLITIVFAVVLKDIAAALMASAGCILLFTLLGLVYRSFNKKK
jgi:protoporphyrinogen IX oxidase